MLFLNNSQPYLRIYNPETEGFAQFQGGKLQLDEDDPDYGVVMAEAQSNPAIQILSDGVQCTACGEPFAGKAAKAQLGKHTKDVHFEIWAAGKAAENEAEIQLEVKRRQPLACEFCPRLQEFPDKESLALHVAALHTNAELDENGNPIGFGDGGGGAAGTSTPAEPPAARVK